LTLRTLVDAGDVVFILGLCVAGYGLWLLDPAWAFIVVGGVLVFVSYLGKLTGALTSVALAFRGQRKK